MLSPELWVGVLAIAVIGVLYPTVVYPVLLLLLRRNRSGVADRSSAPVPIDGFTVIVPAHNEERVIAAKLRNTLAAAKASGYPWQIIVAADGCTDGTCDLVRRFSPDVNLIEVQERGGIVGAFKAGLRYSRFDVVVFSDADIQLDVDNFRQLIRHFSSPNVGGACGATRMVVKAASGLGLEQVNVFLRTWVRERQSEHFATVGADGANWAVRKELIRWPSNSQIAEDLVVPLEIVRQGYRFEFDSSAGALETSPSAVNDEYHRKVRTIAGGIQAGLYCKWMFQTPYRWVGFHYLSWKICKYMVGMWLLLGFIATLMLSATSTAAASLSIGIVVTVLLSVSLRLLASIPIPRPARSVADAVWYALVTLSTPFAAVASLLSRRATTLWRIAPR